MLLQIIDRSVNDQQKQSIEIVFSVDDRKKSFITEYDPASFQDILKKDLSWYFREYLRSAIATDRDVIKRLINHGKYMGNTLQGDDLQLLSYREGIEEFGYSHLEVSVESSRISFFDELWEALILPDSTYILSSVAKSFTRRFNNIPAIADRHEVLKFDLDKKLPLRVLHAIDARSPEISQAYTTAVNLLKYNGVIEYELWSLDVWSALQTRLLEDLGLHIFQYSGTVAYRQGMLFLSVGGGTEAVSLLELVQGLRNAGCALIVLNIMEWRSESELLLAPETGLALAAQIALTAGMPNLIGMSELSDPWTVDNCLNEFYKNILKGLSLAQSVVEARKALQAQTENTSLSFPARPFQSWFLLVHYELQPVLFFSSSQSVSQDIQHTEAYAAIRQKMHGLFTEFLPPHCEVSGDSILLECLSASRAQAGKVIHVHGPQGTGKTQLLHMLAFYLAGGGWHHVFYFDYAEYFYSPVDVQEMTKNLLNTPQEGRESSVVGNGRCIFLLDNYDSELAEQESDIARAALAEYLDGLAKARHLVVVTGSALGASISNEKPIALRPLNTAEQLNMASKLFRDHTIDVSGSAKILLESCHGNPFLIQHILPKFTASSFDELISKTTDLTRDLDRCVDAYYSWQWLDLPLPWRRWLTLLSSLPGMILEMLAVACDSKTPFEPFLRLSRIIGNFDATLSEGIDLMTRAGFTVKHPMGRSINPHSSHFIRRQSTPDDAEDFANKEIPGLLSRIVCKSLAMIIPEVVKRSDQLIIQNLLVNRRLWARHLECVWRDGKYEEFSTTLSSLTELLKLARLSEELALWALNLASENSGAELKEKTPSSEFRLSWLKLIVLALKSQDAWQNPIIGHTAEHCEQWIKSLDMERLKHEAPLFTAIVQFLQTYYGGVQKKAELKEICALALKEYRRHEVWPLVIQTLNMLIECSSDKGEILLFERQLLEEIPLEDLPPVFAWQMKVKVINGRLSRGELDAAQDLLNSLHSSTAIDHQHKLLGAMQADIYYRKEMFKEASAIYQSLINNEVANTESKEFFRQRCAEIEGRLVSEQQVDPLV